MIASLLGEGSSDKVLLPLLRWLVGMHTPEPISIQWVDTSCFQPQRRRLSQKIEAALLAQPCDLLFVHRDSDNQGPEARFTEIAEAIRGDGTLANAIVRPRYVGVVPVRMTEAWLLLDETALRTAAGRPHADFPLGLPKAAGVERLADPKTNLYEALRVAMGSSGRRAQRFAPEAAVHRLANLIDDWSPLRQLPSFQRLEQDTREALAALGLPLNDSA